MKLYFALFILMEVDGGWWTGAHSAQESKIAYSDRLLHLTRNVRGLPNDRPPVPGYAPANPNRQQWRQQQMQQRQQAAHQYARDNQELANRLVLQEMQQRAYARDQRERQEMEQLNQHRDNQHQQPPPRRG